MLWKSLSSYDTVWHDRNEHIVHNLIQKNREISNTPDRYCLIEVLIETNFLYLSGPRTDDQYLILFLLKMKYIEYIEQNEMNIVYLLPGPLKTLIRYFVALFCFVALCNEMRFCNLITLILNHVKKWFLSRFYIWDNVWSIPWEKEVEFYKMVRSEYKSQM